MLISSAKETSRGVSCYIVRFEIGEAQKDLMRFSNRKHVARSSDLWQG